MADFFCRCTPSICDVARDLFGLFLEGHRDFTPDADRFQGGLAKNGSLKNVYGTWVVKLFSQICKVILPTSLTFEQGH